MTRQKIKRTLRRLPYILKMIEEDIKEEKFYISKNTERIVIDEDVKIIVEIINDIMVRNRENWIATVLKRLRAGEKDVKIMMNIPAGQNKYYDTKKEIVHMIYACCVARGLISYEEIISETIG